MTTLRKDNIRLAVRNLSANKGRSFLTTLGIIIGVAAVIVVVSIGQGVRDQISKQTMRYGKDVMVIQGVASGGVSLSGSSNLRGVGAQLTANDIDSIRKNEAVQAVVPLGVVTGSAKGDKTVQDPLIIATSPEFDSVIQHKVEYGGFFDSEPDSKTVVLGPAIAHSLFTDNIPLGQTITIRGERFMIAGIFAPFDASPFSLEANYNDALFIPYTTGRTLVGVDPITTQVLAKLKPDQNLEAVATKVHADLVASHGGANDVTVASVGVGDSANSDTMQLLTVMTAIVAIISFIVGGIGIMNVMLVSVAERIQEVGLRKAIGASNGQILKQFVTEAFMLCLIGAIIGVIVAFVSIGLLRVYTDIEPTIVWPVVAATPTLAVLTGVVFGTFPAAKAARKDPIEALRQR